MSDQKRYTTGDAVEDAAYANQGVSTGTSFNSLLLEQKRRDDALSRGFQFPSEPSESIGPVTAVSVMILVFGFMYLAFHFLVNVGGNEGLIYTGLSFVGLLLLAAILRTSVVRSVLDVLDGIALFIIRITLAVALIAGGIYLLKAVI